MKPRRTCQLCKTTDRPLHFSGGYHHQICKLINDDNDLWKFFLCIFSGLTSQDFFIESFQVPYIVLSEKLITLFHLGNCPVQSPSSLFRISYNRNHQMRDSVIYTQFYNFRIYQDQLHIFRICFVDNAHDQGIDADRFT